MWLLSELLVLFMGQLYPAYMSFKALHSKEAKTISKWVTYWVIFTLWSQAFAIGEFLMLSYLPFWYVAKSASLYFLVREEAAMAESVYQQLLPTFNDVEPRVLLAYERSRELLKGKLEGLKAPAAEALASVKAPAVEPPATAAAPATPAASEMRQRATHETDAPEVD